MEKSKEKIGRVLPNSSPLFQSSESAARNFSWTGKSAARNLQIVRTHELKLTN